MKQTFDIDWFIGYFDNFIDPKECDKIIEFFEQREKTNEIFDRSKSENVEKKNRMDRNTFVNWKDMSLDQFSVNGEAHQGQVALRTAVSVALDLYIKETDILNYIGCPEVHWTPYKLQKTKPGQGFHSWHCEMNGSIDYYNRVIVFTMYLNDIEEGGETEFLHFGKRVKAKKGRICFFPAYFPYVHRGNPPIGKTKYIVTGWFCCDPFMIHRR